MLLLPANNNTYFILSTQTHTHSRTVHYTYFYDNQYISNIYFRYKDCRAKHLKLNKYTYHHTQSYIWNTKIQRKTYAKPLRNIQPIIMHTTSREPFKQSRLSVSVSAPTQLSALLPARSPHHPQSTPTIDTRAPEQC